MWAADTQHGRFGFAAYTLLLVCRFSPATDMTPLPFKTRVFSGEMDLYPIVQQAAWTLSFGRIGLVLPTMPEAPTPRHVFAIPVFGGIVGWG